MNVAMLRHVSRPLPMPGKCDKATLLGMLPPTAMVDQVEKRRGNLVLDPGSVALPHSPGGRLEYSAALFR